MRNSYGWRLAQPKALLPLMLLSVPAVMLPTSGHAAIVKPAEWQLSGRVVSDKGEGLPGVTVTLKGTTRGVSTNVDGNFTLSVPETGGTLVFSFVGYVTQERNFTGAQSFSITLAEDTKALEEVVVVGYGTQKRAEVTGAISSFNAEKLEERPIQRVDQALVGQLAGVQVQQTSGVPGRAFNVRVRGAGSLSAGNEPLYVIDGFPLDNVGSNGAGRYSAGNPLDNINPNDIEKIEVLKDAASAAIYGSRAANGVVLITTKRGKTGKAIINVNSYVGISQPSKKLDLLSPEEWIEHATEYINANWEASAPGRSASETSAQRLAKLNGTFNPGFILDDRWAQPGYPGLQFVDWQDELYRTGNTQNYQVSAAGGTNNVNYYVSGNYTDQQGFTINTSYKRYSARANVEVNATDRLKFGLNLTPSYSITVDPNLEGKDNRFHQLLSMTPVVEDTAGVATAYGKNEAYRWGVSTASPIEVVKSYQGNSKSFRTLASTYAEYQPVKGLRLRSTLNLDNNDVTNKSYTPPARTTVTSLASGSYSSYRRQTFVNENTATYARTFGRHDFSALGGFSYNFSKLDNVALSASGGFINNTVTTLNAATNITGTSSNFTTETQNVLLSYFGRLQYSFDSKYLLSASVRRDGSSRFGQETRWGVFPAVSAGWRIAQEGFMLNQNVVSDLKLRGSLGYSGNNSIGDYSAIPTLGFYNYPFGGNAGVQFSGQAPNKAANPNLKWERNRTIDFGLDYGFLKNRITGSFDVYTKTSNGLLLSVAIPTASGFGSYLDNIGEIENRGWELELTSRNVEGAFSWTTSANLSHNQNEVKHLGPGDAPIEVTNGLDTPSEILKVGSPIYSFFVVKQIGILTQADVDNKVAMYGTQKAGDPRYEDVNGDGKIDSNDRQIVGQPNPKYYWGVTNTFRYKGFDLSVLVQGQNGGNIYSALGRAIDRTNYGYRENVLGRVNDRWRSPDSPGNGIEGKAFSSPNWGFVRNTNWLYSSNYTRIRQITLGYDLGLLIPKKAAQGARIYVTAENWFGWDKYTGGLNPDAINTSNTGVYTSGTDYGGLPLAKSLVLGLNLTF